MDKTTKKRTPTASPHISEVKGERPLFLYRRHLLRGCSGRLFCSSFFLSRSLFGFSGSFSSSLSFSFGELLSSYSSSLGLVGSLFGFQSSLSGVSLVLSQGLTDRAKGTILLRLPCFELSVSGLLVECALSDTTEEVLLQENAFVREDATSRVGRLCTSREPIQSALEVQIYCGRIGVGVVRTNLLNKLAISWRSTVSDDDLIEGISLATVAL